MQDQNQAPATGQNIALLPPPERAQIVLESTKTESTLRGLVEQSKGIVSVLDPASREEAHRAAMNLRNARTAITKAGKTARDDANAFCSAVIAEEKRLIALITSEEDRVFDLRDAYDARVRAEKEEAERKERERVAAIRAKIEGIRALSAASFRDSAEQIADTLADLEAFEMNEAEFAEFAGEASEVKAKAMGELRDLHEKAVAAEAESARVAAERAELERQRAELAAQEAERDRVASETKRQLEAQQAEIARQRQAEENRLKAEREAFEAERRAFQEQQAAAAREAEEKAAAANALNDLLPNEHTSAHQEQFAAQAQDLNKQMDEAVAPAAQVDGPESEAAGAVAAEMQEEIVVMIEKDDEIMGSVRVTDIAHSDADDHAKDDAMAVRCIEVGVLELVRLGRAVTAIREVFESALVAALDQHQEAA